MSSSPFHHQRAVWLFAVVLAVLCSTSCVSAFGTLLDYTPLQQAHTLRFLLAFTETMPALRRQWQGSDFCHWTGVTCHHDGVSVESSTWPLVSFGNGYLPELPRTVDGAQVVVTKLVFGYHTDRVYGTLPASWGRLVRLSELDLRSKSLYGTLPSSWEGMQSLTSLRLSANGLFGTLPARWARLTYLATLDLDSNGIGGTLPSSWSAMESLQTLTVRQNRLSGPLPESWGQMNRLMYLNVSHNSFYGRVPASWGLMPGLQSVSLSNTYLCGCLPAGWQQGSVVVAADAGMWPPYCSRPSQWCWGDTTTAAPLPSSSPSSSSMPSNSSSSTSGGEGDASASSSVHVTDSSED